MIRASTKVREVLERLKPYSETPKYRRLIRFLWWYFVNNARKESRQGVKAVTESVKKMIGEQDMSMVLDMLKAEGAAEGEARGRVFAVLETRFSKVPHDVEKTVRAMTDLIALESLARIFHGFFFLSYFVVGRSFS